MVAIDLSFGWLLIVLGTVLLLVEAFNPGFFIAVPGTVLIIIGILFVLGIDIFSSPFGVVVGVVIAIAAAGLTVWKSQRSRLCSMMSSSEKSRHGKR